MLSSKLSMMPTFVRLMLLLVVVAALVGCGSSDTPSASEGRWGPLAVAEGPPSDNEALVAGTIEITDECVFLRNGDDRSLLVWPSEGTQWDSKSQTIRYAADSAVELRDGDSFSVGGGGSSEAESGVADEVWVDSIAWAAEPNPACFTSTRDFVGFGPKK